MASNPSSDSVRQDLADIGWTLGEAARKLDVPGGTLRSWLHRNTMPAAERAWLARCADWHRKNPFEKEDEQ